MKKETRLSQRQDPEIIDALKTLSDESGLSQKAIIAACITGLKKTWDTEREITFPFRVISQRRYLELTTLQEPPQLVAEDSDEYGR